MDIATVTITTKCQRSKLATLLFSLMMIAGGQLSAQSLSAIQLDAPILPEGVTATELASPAPVAGMPHVGAQQIPVGSSISPQQIQQASFVGCTACGSIGCGGCDEFAGPGFQRPPAGLGLWIRADYLIWYEKDSKSIPLVTSSTGFTADPEDLLTIGAGALNPGPTRIIFGDEDLSDNPLDGWRVEVGAWLDAAATFGIVGRYFDVAGRDITFNSGPADSNFLGIPFFDAEFGEEDAVNLIVPNERTGFVNVNLRGDVKNWEILFRRLAETGSNYRMDWLYGYRNFTMDESLRMESTSIVTGGNAILDTRIDILDQFDVENQFHGIDLGFTGHSHQGCWSLDFLAKVALGVMDNEVDVSGNQLVIIPDIDPTRNVGGLFSQESNIGKNSEKSFSVIPEFDINLGYGVTPNLDFSIGYTFMYVTNVVRAASSIDRVVNIGRAVDLDPVFVDRPQVDLDGSGYFLHGLNLGVTGRF